MTQRKKTTAASTAGSFAPHTRNGAEVTFHVATPSEIDGRLAHIYIESERAQYAVQRARDFIERYEGNTIYASRIPHYEKTLVGGEERIEECALEAEPLEAEYQKAPWTRAFLVPGGHVHSSRSCSTCFPSTTFAWMTEYSGRDEEDIVADAGERACTVCYPSAPVDTLSRPTRMYSPDEVKAQQEREEREARRAEAARVKLEKAIANPDGSPLREPKYNRVIETLTSAERELTSAIARARLSSNGEHRAHLNTFIEMLVVAVAHKKGISENEVRETFEKKATAKLKRVGF